MKYVLTVLSSWCTVDLIGECCELPYEFCTFLFRQHTCKSIARCDYIVLYPANTLLSCNLVILVVILVDHSMRLEDIVPKLSIYVGQNDLIVR